MLTVHDFLLDSAERFPDKEALVFKETRLTYREVARRACAVADTLVEMGLRPGERVGIHLEKGVDEAVAIFGASLAGGVFVVLNPALLPDQLVYIAHDCGVAAIVTTSGRLARLPEAVAPDGPIRFAVLTDARDAPLPLPVARFSHEAAPSRRPLVNPADLASIIYTSGSTGNPKGVMLTHLNVALSALSCREYLQAVHHDRMLCLLPFSFDFGLQQLTTCFSVGGTAVIKRFVFAKDVLDLMAAERITAIGATPTIWLPLVDALDRHDFPHLRYLANSGGKVPVRYLLRMLDAFPDARIYSMYGFTEAFRATFLDPADLRRLPESVGKAIPFADVHVIDEEGRECAPGEVGECIQRGPLVSKGYWGRPDATALKIRQSPFHELFADPTCWSGDLVRKDEEGNLYFLGRKDHMIKCSGFRISPTEIEERMQKVEGVREAVAFGVADERLGERIHVVVTLSDGASVDERRLMEACRRLMPAYMTPHQVAVVAEMPLTGNGKIDRPALVGAAHPA